MNKIIYGEQRTPEWQELRLGLFTSSIIYHLFEDSSKQAKSTALMQQLKEGVWSVTNEVLTYRPNSQELKYICEYLVKFSLIKSFDVPFIKKDLKEVLKGGVLSASEYTKDCLLVLTACYALKNIEVASGSMQMICKKKAEDIIWEKEEETPITKAMQWGIDNEALALQYFEIIALEILQKDNEKVSFVMDADLQTGSSPDGTISTRKGLIPVEVKNPFNRGIHYDHCKIKTADDLFQFDRQKYFQIQHQIFCLGAEYGWFVSFDKRLLGTKYAHKALHYIKIEPNKKVQNEFEPRLAQAVKLRDKFISEF